MPKNNYNTRNSQNITSQLCRTTYHFNSFFPSSIRLWNNLPQNVKDSKSLISFKTTLSTLCNPGKIPSYYYVGSRRGQVLHTRIRTRCSALKQHLYLRNIETNPYCQCGQVESAAHFLLECSNYTNLRADLLNLNFPVTCNLLLFGDENKSFEFNKNIFLEVQKYILKSKRFS